MVDSRVVGRIRSPAVALLLAAVAGALAWRGTPVGSETATMLGIAAFCIVLWVLTPIPPSYTGLVCIGLVGATFSADLALVGFQSPATWLVGFGLLVGEATRRSGLGSWAGRWLVARSVPDRARDDPVRAYASLLAAMCAGAVSLAFLVPSTLVRVLVLAPVLRETGSLFDSREAKVGLFVAPLFATFYGSVGIFTAGLPNIVISGIAESVGGPSVSWTRWTATLFPVMTVGRTLLIAGATFVMYRPSASATVDVPEGGPATPSASVRRMFLFLLVGVAVWMTDSVHGLHPLFGAIAVVVLAFLPRVGVVDFEDVSGAVDYSILFFIGAVFAVGEGLARTGFADSAAESLLALVPTDAGLPVTLGVVFLATLALTFLMEGLAVASVVTPVVVEYAGQVGVPVEPVMMTEAMALATYFFPFQSAVLVGILAEDVVDAPELIRSATVFSLLSIVVLVPIQVGILVLLY
ncbi:SLC13 family permease [Halorussus sp. MSC15.2]|uniref:SLC13 family permease n=1 Tax=Halorussus sp. MSC15.2 TaxID=2283638 RepID=UPI0013D5E553|nr:SLC13 family permease [Halorussus sp. MSC15.2]NEU58892.1 sodium:sulfate symporter [Halorussus sp. MSC15.2]